MSARFRRRGEIVEACRFDGTNAEECAQLVEYRLEEFLSHWKVGDWAVSVGLTSCRDHYDDRQFRSYFEPVPLPEPAPVDGWEQWALVDRSKPKELQLIGFFDSEAEATIQISQFNMAGELIKVSVLPAPPVVEGGK